MLNFFRFGNFGEPGDFEDGKFPPPPLDGLTFPNFSRAQLERIRIGAAVELLGGPLIAKYLDFYLHCPPAVEHDTALAREISISIFPKRSNKSELLIEYLLALKNPNMQLNLGSGYSLAYLLANSSTSAERAVGRWAIYSPLNPSEKAIIDQLTKALESGKED